jgi:hypothetical protein
MKTLKESILANVDTVLDKDNAYSIMYPAPKLKDFEKIGKSTCYTWQCPELIQQYIKEFDFSNYEWISVDSLKDITGIRCEIRSDKIIETSVVNKYGGNEAWICAGDWYSNSLPDSKKHCIWFLTQLAENPEVNFRKLIAFHNKSENEKKQKGFCDCKTYDKILK